MEGKNKSMIPFDFEYYRPASIQEAYDCYHKLIRDNKKPLYYSGGTEIISMARVGSLEFDSVIDIKGIPECNELQIINGEFVIGSARTLTQIAQYNAYPLLSDTIKRIADHTIQGKITIGGNLAGTIQYREASLPLMISNCNVKVMTHQGLTAVPFLKVFDGRLNLNAGEFLVSISINKKELMLPYNHVKKTKIDKIDYPLITLAAAKNNTSIKAAITGYGDKPILLPAKILNDNYYKTEDRIMRLIGQFKDDCKSDLSGSREYREFVLKNMLEQMYENFEKVR